MTDLEPHPPSEPPQLRLIVVQNERQPCPYLDGVTARMPLRLPVGHVTPEATDRLLELGFRRSGDFVYRTECPTCQECQPTRVELSSFRLTKSMKRVQKRGDRELECRWGPPAVDDARISLFNQHRNLRNLSKDQSDVNAEAYRAFLADTCCDTRELSIYREGQLLAVAIVDVGTTSVSSVYTHFDPSDRRYSLGTYAILRQMQWAEQTGRRYLYLGMYVAENSHLNYKARFSPQHRLIDGSWQEKTLP